MNYYTKLTNSKDFIYLYGLLTIAFISVYFLPGIPNKLIFLLLLIFYYRSNKNFVWFAFLLILVEGPAHFFDNTTREAIYRLPLYSISGSMSFSFFDLFLFVSIMKLWKINKFRIKLYKSTNNSIIYLFLFYVVVITLPVTLVYGAFDLLNQVRFLVYFLFYFIFLGLSNDYQNLLRISKLMVPILLFHFLNQVFYMSTGSWLINFVDPSYITRNFTDNITGLPRAASGWTILPILALVYQGYKIHNRPSFLNISIILLIISIALFSGARSMLIITIIIISSSLILGRSTVKRGLSSSLIGLSIIIFLFLLFNSDYSQYFARQLNFINNLVEGDAVSSTQSLQGKINDANNVLKGIINYPFFGVGFSVLRKDYYLPDVGFLANTLTYGILGFMFILYFLLYNLSKSYQFRKHEVFSLMVLSSLIGVLILYLSTWNFISPTYKNRFFYILLLISHFEMYLRCRKIKRH